MTPSNADRSPSVQDSPVNPLRISSPPAAASPPASSALNSAPSLKKRLINEYELEQHRPSPVETSPAPSTPAKLEIAEDESAVNSNESDSKTDAEAVSKIEAADETVCESVVEGDQSS